MAFDLTGKIAPFLDRHLVFPLLEFLQEQQTYPEDEILKAKIELLGKTNMVDYMMDIHKSIYGTEDVPQAMTAHRVEVMEQMDRLGAAAAPLIEFLQDAEKVGELRPDKQYNLHMLQHKYQIGEEHVEALYAYAKFRYECGDYSGAAAYLYQYRSLCTNTDKSMNALWGKVATEILVQNWDVAAEELNKLKEIIDSKSFSDPLEQLQQRTWVLHWSLFIHYNSSNGKNSLIDLFFQDKYLNALQTNGQHLVRYLCQAVLTNKRRRNLIKDLVKVVQQGAHAYQDPITHFVDCLFVKFDLEGAQQRLQECEEVFACDFFLGKRVEEGGYEAMPFREEFLEAGRSFIFETYCKIHQVIDIKMLAEKLNMTADAAERWIVNLINNAKLDAKIDSKAGTVVMAQNSPSVYETIVEKSKETTRRTYLLHQNVMNTHPALAAQ